MKSKFIFFPFYLFLIISFASSLKLHLRNKIKLKDKYTLISVGDRIDGRYRVIEKTNEMTCPAMNEEW